ncbi:hypothetical protein PS718_01637 [Pseudomonas fluorescens]|uniref:Lipoprotein n=1 Tax=Pseudomonas fluorescens TaxID=294 RepID=A0A5E7BA57_PSEFL|nr:hypothetical protein [Pseudomonas fluorescens]VVN87820.1 hypothetical protein PS718_01637 [Pseudomonas fluorescens]
MTRVFPIMAVLSVAMLSGCSDESKMKSVCTDILHGVAIDPSSVKINKVEVSEGKLSHLQALDRYSEAADGKIGDATKRYLSSLYEGGDGVSEIFTEVNYTANARSGIQRSSVLCSFIKPASSKPFLSSVTVNNRDIQGFALSMMLSGSKRPSGLGVDMKLN